MERYDLLRDLLSVCCTKIRVITDEDDLIEEYSFDKCPRNLLERSEENIAFAVVRVHHEHYTSAISRIVVIAHKYGMKIIARGGGSGVCGAAVPRFGKDTIVLDMTSLNSVEIDEESHSVIAGAGIIGSELEKEVGLRGYTLGHSPASLAISTPGGWVAAGSSGQFSVRHGNIENLVLGIEVIDAEGNVDWVTGDNLHSYFRMEGTTGIITKVQMKIFSNTAHKVFRAYSFGNLESALSAFEIAKKLGEQATERDVYLGAIRLYDFLDYSFVARPHKAESSNHKNGSYGFEKLLASHPAQVNSALNLLERIRLTRSVLLLFFESNYSADLSRYMGAVDFELSRLGKAEKSTVAKTWYENRYKIGYDKLKSRYEHGMIVDTFDCRVKDIQSASRVYGEVKAAVANLAVAGAHFGIDRESPYIYFTFVSVGGLQRYDKIWEKILDACYDNGGLTTHHHGIGSLKAGRDNRLAFRSYGPDWLTKASGVKHTLDKDNIFNPGNIFNQ